MDIVHGGGGAPGTSRVSGPQPPERRGAPRGPRPADVAGRARARSRRARLFDAAIRRHRRRRTGRDHAWRAAAAIVGADDCPGEAGAPGRQLAPPLQDALPARPGLVRPFPLHPVPAELAGVRAEGSDGGLDRGLRGPDGDQLLVRRRMHVGPVRRFEKGMGDPRRQERRRDYPAAETPCARHRDVGLSQDSRVRRDGAVPGRHAPLLAAPRPGRIRRKIRGRHRREQFRPRHRVRAVGGRRAGGDRAEIVDARDEIRIADGVRLGAAVLRGRS